MDAEKHREVGRRWVAIRRWYRVHGFRAAANKVCRIRHYRDADDLMEDLRAFERRPARMAGRSASGKCKDERLPHQVEHDP